jgi:hypothetical protein
MSDISSALHQSDIPCSKGRDYSEEDQRHSDRGSIPKESSGKGEHPQGENYPFPLMSKGER